MENLSNVCEVMLNDNNIVLTKKGKYKLKNEDFLDEYELNGTWYIDSVKCDGTITICSTGCSFTTVELEDIKIHTI